tara:strand:+ start:412 stop:819 length:408 start_codon:yes stop_codon:yes gene_type:complete
VGLIIDTSILISIERSSLNIDKLIEGREDEAFGISAISVSELLHGVHRADSQKRRLKREAYVEKIIELMFIYPFDLTVSRIYARIWADLAKKNVRIGAHDLIIASTAISLGFSVATYDLRDYKKIKSLTIEKIKI